MFKINSTEAISVKMLKIYKMFLELDCIKILTLSVVGYVLWLLLQPYFSFDLLWLNRFPLTYNSKLK